MVQVDQDVPRSPSECLAQRNEFGRAARYARGGLRVDSGWDQCLAHAYVGHAVGMNDVLVGAPRDPEYYVLIVGKQIE